MVQFHPKPKPQSTFTEKNRELQQRLSIKKYGMRGLTVKMGVFLFVWLSPWKKKFSGIKWLNKFRAYHNFKRSPDTLNKSTPSGVFDYV